MGPDCGVADQDVDFAEFLHGGGDHASYLGLVGHIGQVWEGFHAQLSGLGGHRLGLLPVGPRVDHHVGALGGHLQDHGAADVAA